MDRRETLGRDVLVTSGLPSWPHLDSFSSWSTSQRLQDGLLLRTGPGREAGAVGCRCRQQGSGQKVMHFRFCSDHEKPQILIYKANGRDELQLGIAIHLPRCQGEGCASGTVVPRKLCMAKPSSDSLMMRLTAGIIRSTSTTVCFLLSCATLWPLLLRHWRKCQRSVVSSQCG